MLKTPFVLDIYNFLSISFGVFSKKAEQKNNNNNNDSQSTENTDENIFVGRIVVLPVAEFVAPILLFDGNND